MGFPEQPKINFRIDTPIKYLGCIAGIIFIISCFLPYQGLIPMKIIQILSGGTIIFTFYFWYVEDIFKEINFVNNSTKLKGFMEIYKLFLISIYLAFVIVFTIKGI